MIEIFIKVLSLKIVMRFPESIFHNNIACEGTKQVENIERLPSVLKISHSEKYFLGSSLYYWLKLSYVCFRKEGVEGTSSDAV
jgi:hypothetical protein